MIVPAALKLRQAAHDTEAVSTMLLSFPMTNNGMEDDRVLSIDGSSKTTESVFDGLCVDTEGAILGAGDGIECSCTPPTDTTH